VSEEARPPAELVLPCRDLAASLAFFTERLGFRLDAIFPADAPATARLSGHGQVLVLERGTADGPARLRLGGAPAESLATPGGFVVERAPAAPPLAIPPARIAFQHVPASASAWGVGRAGMEYRDLLPGRAGGHLIASHIRIPGGGPVPDSVHYHEVGFQMIYCRRGWARLVYEDQGPPFVLAPGDCVLQPPGIRHRVLESGDALEVIELAVPAEHVTRLDHELVLPTPHLRPERLFAGQRFVRHERARSRPAPSFLAGCVARDLGLGPATGERVRASVHASVPGGEAPVPAPAAAFRFCVLLAGGATLAVAGRPLLAVGEGDAWLVPGPEPFGLTDGASGLELLEVAFA